MTKEYNKLYVQYQDRYRLVLHLNGDLDKFIQARMMFTIDGKFTLYKQTHKVLLRLEYFMDEDGFMFYHDRENSGDKLLQYGYFREDLKRLIGNWLAEVGLFVTN